MLQPEQDILEEAVRVGEEGSEEGRAFQIEIQIEMKAHKNSSVLLECKGQGQK